MTKVVGVFGNFSLRRFKGATSEENHKFFLPQSLALIEENYDIIKDIYIQIIVQKSTCWKTFRRNEAKN
jgi:hypothetical protein